MPPEFFRPEWRGGHAGNVASELRQQRGRGHGLAEGEDVRPGFRAAHWLEFSSANYLSPLACHGGSEASFCFSSATTVALTASPEMLRVSSGSASWS